MKGHKFMPGRSLEGSAQGVQQTSRTSAEGPQRVLGDQAHIVSKILLSFRR